MESCLLHLYEYYSLTWIRTNWICSRPHDRKSEHSYKWCSHKGRPTYFHFIPMKCKARWAFALYFILVMWVRINVKYCPKNQTRESKYFKITPSSATLQNEMNCIIDRPYWAIHTSRHMPQFNAHIGRFSMKTRLMNVSLSRSRPYINVIFFCTYTTYMNIIIADPTQHNI